MLPIVVAAIAVVLLVALVCWVLLFPETVESLRQALARRFGGFRRRAGRWQGRSRRHAGAQWGS